MTHIAFEMLICTYMYYLNTHIRELYLDFFKWWKLKLFLNTRKSQPRSKRKAIKKFLMAPSEIYSNNNG